MPRYEVYHKDKGLAFGSDGCLSGEFLQIWSRPTDKEERAAQDKFGPDELLIDEDTHNTGLTFTRMQKIIKEHGFSESELSDAKRFQ